MKTSYVYIMASGRNGTLYVGVTANLIKRVREHKDGTGSTFVKKYRVTQLVHFEQANDVTIAIEREAQLKNWKRAWKIELIEKTNPSWRDLTDELF